MVYMFMHSFLLHSCIHAFMRVCMYACKQSCRRSVFGSKPVLLLQLLFPREGPAVGLAAGPGHGMWLEDPLAHTALAHDWHKVHALVRRAHSFPAWRDLSLGGCGAERRCMESPALHRRLLDPDICDLGAQGVVRTQPGREQPPERPRHPEKFPSFLFTRGPRLLGIVSRSRRTDRQTDVAFNVHD